MATGEIVGLIRIRDGEDRCQVAINRGIERRLSRPPQSVGNFPLRKVTDIKPSVIMKRSAPISTRCPGKPRLSRQAGHRLESSDFRQTQALALRSLNIRPRDRVFLIGTRRLQSGPERPPARNPVSSHVGQGWLALLSAFRLVHGYHARIFQPLRASPLLKSTPSSAPRPCRP